MKKKKQSPFDSGKNLHTFSSILPFRLATSHEFRIKAKTLLLNNFRKMHINESCENDSIDTRNCTSETRCIHLYQVDTSLNTFESKTIRTNYKSHFFSGRSCNGSILL